MTVKTSPQTVGSQPTYKSPQTQLWEMTTECQHDIIRQVLRRLKKRDQQDLCYGLIAYLRFKIRRTFECRFMQVLFESFIDLFEADNSNKKI